jgi:hypothetical protein
VIRVVWNRHIDNRSEGERKRLSEEIKSQGRISSKSLWIKKCAAATMTPPPKEETINTSTSKGADVYARWADKHIHDR